MTNEEQEDLTAELLATNQTLVFIVRSIASLAEKEGIPREVFFRTWLENGTQAMARTKLVGIPPRATREGAGESPCPVRRPHHGVCHPTDLARHRWT
jgi:hypothetical protein